MQKQNDNLTTALLGLGKANSGVSLNHVIEAAASSLQASDEKIVKLLANAHKFPEAVRARIESGELRIERTTLIVRRDITSATGNLSIVDDNLAISRGITPFEKGKFPAYMEAGVITGLSVAYSRNANTVTLANAAYSNQSIHAEFNGAITADLELQVGGGASYILPHRAMIPASTMVPGLTSDESNVYELSQGLIFKKDDNLKAMMNLASGVTLTPTTNYVLYAEYAFNVIYFRAK